MIRIVSMRTWCSNRYLYTYLQAVKNFEKKVNLETSNVGATNKRRTFVFAFRFIPFHRWSLVNKVSTFSHFSKAFAANIFPTLKFVPNKEGTPIFGRFIREFREQPQVARFFADLVFPHLQSRRRAEKGYKMSAAVPFLPMSPALEGIPGEGWTGEPMAKKTFFPEKITKWGCLRTPMVTIFITIDWDVYLVDKHPFATYLTQCSSMFFPRLEPDRWGGRLWPHGILSGHWHPLAAGGGEPGYGPGFHKEMLAGHIYIYIICGIYVYIYMLRDTAIFDTFLNFMVSETTRWWKTTLIFPTESRDEHPWAAAILMW